MFSEKVIRQNNTTIFQRHFPAYDNHEITIVNPYKNQKNIWIDTPGLDRVILIPELRYAIFFDDDAYSEYFFLPNFAIAFLMQELGRRNPNPYISTYRYAMNVYHSEYAKENNPYFFLFGEYGSDDPHLQALAEADDTHPLVHAWLNAISYLFRVSSSERLITIENREFRTWKHADSSYAPVHIGYVTDEQRQEIIQFCVIHNLKYELRVDSKTFCIHFNNNRFSMPAYIS